jgi:hypothetical protein
VICFCVLKLHPNNQEYESQSFRKTHLPRLQSGSPQEKSLHCLQEESPPQTAAGIGFYFIIIIS